MSKIEVKVCTGTNCFSDGTVLLQQLVKQCKEKYGEKVSVSGSPCFRLCSVNWDKTLAPYVKIDNDFVKQATIDKIFTLIDDKLSK